MRERPTSPHLTIYRYRYTVVTSISNRAMGIVLSVGLLLLVYWLMAVASGAKAYERAQAVLSLGIFKVIYAGLLIAFCYHFVAGIRHLVWDTGHGMERAQSERSAWIVAGSTLVLVLVLGYWIVHTSRGAP
jgi:succinate dehydrogenase / fumarate reductase cytochrome b subunit